MELFTALKVKDYKRKDIISDFIAGLTVAVILIPQGMAYSLLAGLSPIYGLYAALVPMLLYPLFASSRELSVGPVALMSIIILSGVSIYAEPGSQKYLDMVLMSGFLAGVIQILFAIFKLGSYSNFLSKPVMSGFISAAGVIIAISQIKYLLAIDTPRSVSVTDMIEQVFSNIGGTNYISLLMGLGGILILYLLSKIHKAIPGPLLIVILGSVILYYLNLDKEGVKIVGDLPKGIPGFYIGFWKWEYIFSLIPPALIISIICFIGSFSIAKTMSTHKGDYEIDPNKELMGLGMAKLVGSFFLAMPSTGSFTRSAINEQAGSKSGYSSIFGALFIGLTLMFFGPLFYYLPEPILAAIVITSVFSLINVKDAKDLFKLDRRDFWILIATFLLTLFLGIVNGILLGIAISLFSIVQKASKPHYAVLGKLPGTDTYRNIERFSEAKEEEEVLIIRYDQDLFFGNAEHFYTTILKEINKRKGIKKVIVKASAFHNLDSTSMYKINMLNDFCKTNGIRLIFTDMIGPVRDNFRKAGLYERIGDENFYLSHIDAVKENTDEESYKLSNKYSRQTNKK